MKPRFRIIFSRVKYNYQYGVFAINDEAKVIGDYAMYVDGKFRRMGFSILQDKFLQNE